MQRNTLINKEKNPATSTEKMNKGHRQANNRRETQEATKHMAGCLKSLMVRKMQIQYSTRYHLAPIRLATIRKLGNVGWRGFGNMEVNHVSLLEV